MDQKVQKNIFVSKVIAFELVGVNSYCYEENTTHGQSMFS